MNTETDMSRNNPPALAFRCFSVDEQEKSYEFEIFASDCDTRLALASVEYRDGAGIIASVVMLDCDDARAAINGSIFGPGHMLALSLDTLEDMIVAGVTR